MNLDIDIIPLTKINSNWTISLNVKHKTIKILEDNIREYPGNLGYVMTFRYNIKVTIHERKN